MISFEIPGDPRGKGRPKFARRGDFVQTYTDDKTASYENLVSLAARDAMKGRPLFSGPMHFEMVATFKVPASMSAKKREAMLLGEIKPTKKPDLDNIQKAVLDGMNGVVFEDDAQVVTMLAGKQYGSPPRVWVHIRPIDEA